MGQNDIRSRWIETTRREDDVASTTQGTQVEEEQDRRQIVGLIFFYKCVHSLIDSLYLVGAIQSHRPSRSLLRPKYKHFGISNSRLNIRNT